MSHQSPMQASITLDTLYRDHYSRVAAFIHRKYPMIDSEDVTQSAYLAYWRKYPDCDCGDREPIKVLLYLARLSAINTIRKATRLKRSDHRRIDCDVDVPACGPQSTILDDLPESLQPIAEKLIQGHSIRSLYDQFGQYTVRQSIEQLREILSR